MYDTNVGKIQRLCLLPDIFITQFLFYLGSQIGFENNGIGKKHVSYEAIMVGNGIENYYWNSFEILKYVFTMGYKFACFIW